MAGGSCRHTQHGGGQCRQQGSGTTISSLAATGALAVQSSPGCVNFTVTGIGLEVHRCAAGGTLAIGKYSRSGQ